MTDGPMEAYRDSVRAKAYDRFLCQLARYLKRPGPKAKKALEERAAETDEVRGGMVGTTQWGQWLERNLERLRERKRGEGDAAWMRLLLMVRDDPWQNDEDNGNEVINLYESLLRISPFARDQIIFPKENLRILVKNGKGARPLNLPKLKKEAFDRAGIDPSDDEFVFVLKLKRSKVSLEPIWIRQTTFQNSVPARKGPIRKSA